VNLHERSIPLTLVGRRPGPLEDVAEQEGLAQLAEPDSPGAAGPGAADEGGAARAAHLRRRPRTRRSNWSGCRSTPPTRPTSGTSGVRAMSLNRLRLLAILVPLGALLVVDYVRHRILYPALYQPPGGVVMWIIVALGIAGFSFAVFGHVARLEQMIVQQNAELSVLNDIALASAENLELGQLLEITLDKVVVVMKADAGVICLHDTETDELVAACYRGLSDEVVEMIRRQKVGAEPIGTQVVRTGCPVVVDELLEHPTGGEIARREGFRSSVSVPLKAEGEVTGVLALITRVEHHFSADEVELLGGIGAQLGLAVRKALLFSKAQQRNAELAALLAVGRASASSFDLSKMLDEALDAILRVTSAETAGIWFARDGAELSLDRVRGIEAEAFWETTRLRKGEGFPGLAFASGTPVMGHDLESDGHFVGKPVAMLGFKSYCALPLRRGNESVGVLAVASRDPEALCSSAELTLLQGIGEQLAVAIENARLHERVLDVVVIEERERISRELHDSLGQVLGYINTQALAIRKLLVSGRVTEAQAETIAIEETARWLYTDVREAILELRTSPIAEGGLIPSLRAHVRRYAELTGIDANVEVTESQIPAVLSASSEIQLLRIVQEALTNVRKHSTAKRATVTVEVTADALAVTVDDDGRGFDPERATPTGWPHFGLQTMRERAEAIGGRFDIRSRPGVGTRVEVVVARERLVEVRDASLAR